MNYIYFDFRIEHLKIKARNYNLYDVENDFINLYNIFLKYASFKLSILKFLEIILNLIFMIDNLWPIKTDWMSSY